MTNGVSTPFGRFSIRFKLLYSYGLTFLFAIVLGNALLYLFIRKTLENDIERELTTTTQIIRNIVETSTDLAIKNHLRAVTEKNRDIVNHFYQMQREGILSEKEAKSQAASILLSQTIGTTGYIYCINSTGDIQVHPSKELAHKNLSNFTFIKDQMAQKEGFLEYDWANPGEETARPKALYMTYFKPWDWIIAASSYRDEFNKLFDVGDIREGILSITFGKTGYPYVIDSKGNLIIHPVQEGVNIFESKDSSGRFFIKEMCARKNGRIIYPWQNPGDPEPREKLVIFSYIPELDWIVASSSYLEEFYEPLRTIGYTSLGMVVVTVLFLIPITWWLSTSITRPIQKMAGEFSCGASGDFSSRMRVNDKGEIGQLACYYNRFMEQLQTSHNKLQESEKKFRGIFENAVEGVFQTSAEGRIISANPALAQMLGYRDETTLLELVDDLKLQVYVNPQARDDMLALLLKHGVLHGFETQFRRADGVIIWVSINARIVKDSSGDIATIEGFISNITHRKEAEEALFTAKKELELRVEERTMELSNWVRTLETLDNERSRLQNLGQMIQLCRTRDETYPIIMQFLRSFFPEETLALYICNDEGETLIPAASREDLLSFGKNECWALRQGKPYVSDTDNCLPKCLHLNSDAPNGYSCTPLIAQGELIGLIHIIFNKSSSKSNEDKQRLATVISDQLALALANLKLRESLRLQSIQDPLTTLYNRRFLEEIIAQFESRSLRRNRHFGVLMIDIDHFKKINDVHGHDVGDAVLRQLGTFIIGYVRAEDIPCRYGGEEFVVIMDEISLDELRDRARNICTTIADKVVVPLKNTELRITVSVGAALFPMHGKTAAEVLKAADTALYQAKESGRNRVVVAENPSRVASA